MQSTLGTYTSNRNIGPVGKVRVSKPISRAAAVIGILQFLIAAALVSGGTFLYAKQVNDDIKSDDDPKLYGLWSAPGPLIVGICGVTAWWLRKRDMIIIFSVINFVNIVLCIVQAVFVLPVAFWFKDFITLSRCRENDLDGHGLVLGPEGKVKRNCDDMNVIAKIFLLLAVSCCIAIVISIAGVVNGILGVIKMRKDQIEQMDGITNEEFRQMEQKTAMWLENNVRFSTSSTLARSERGVSESAFSTGPGYQDKSWV